MYSKYLFPLIFIFGCSQENQKYLLENADLQEEFEIKYSHAKWVQPSNLNDFNVGTFSKVTIYQNFIIALDREVTKTLFVWDTTGKSLFKIMPQPGAENEVKTIYDFCIHTENKEILILDPSLHSIKSYDINSGEFKKSYIIGDHYFNLEYLSPTKLLLYYKPVFSKEGNDDNQRFFIYDLNDQKADALDISIGDQNSFISHEVNENVLLKYKNTIYSTEALNDTIYYFQHNNQTINEANFSNLSWSLNTLSKKNAGSLEDYKNHKQDFNFLVGQGSLAVNDTLIFLASEKNKAFFYGMPIPNIKQPELVKFVRLVIKINDNNFGLPLGFNGLGEELIFPVPWDYAMMVKNKSNPKSVINNFDENGNDILLIINP